MGLIHVTVRLKASQDAKEEYEAGFLIDTGATDCLAPASKAEEGRHSLYRQKDIRIGVWKEGRV